ncbi:hypothetical protein [Thalassoroseus pseudoceratinae]|uniref:hypothetical protein n=1 Tax=Thalassoroseus pseudoceratinae TaxID=2713176 RepID=UPI001420BD11|nr:hypothetical protein [Thalassoroseus pseudoceratinae]
MRRTVHEQDRRLVFTGGDNCLHEVVTVADFIDVDANDDLLYRPIATTIMFRVR